MMPDVAHTPVGVPDTIDGSMTIAEVAEVLANLRFNHSHRMAALEVDKDVAAYFLGLIPAAQRHRAG